MLAGKSPFDVGGHDMSDQSTEDYLFQGMNVLHTDKHLYTAYDIVHTFNSSCYVWGSTCMCDLFMALKIFILFILFLVILEKTIRIPRTLSVKAAQVSP